MVDETTVTAVVGTRPEIIKMAPVIRALQSSHRFRLDLIHTNQHYDTGLSTVFFDNLNLPVPDANLDVGSGSHGLQTSTALARLVREFEETKPSAVLAVGDTNTVLSSALAASKRPEFFGHVEAGIRSYDRSMPEEVNRVVADHLSDILFAPTRVAEENLSREGIEEQVFVTGNTIVDACLEHVPIAAERSDVLERLGLTSREYVVATIHRPSNTDNTARLRQIMNELSATEPPVIFPAHPRTRRVLDEIGHEGGDGVWVIEPLDYLDFLRLEGEAYTIVTDSGGIQEEASILEVPCLTVRPNTERPETIDAGVNKLLEPNEISKHVNRLWRDDDEHRRMVGEPNLYGDGDAGRQIVRILEETL